MALVSIIVPCFNYGWVLAETLDSLLAQQHTHWECLIVDDGSTDDTRAVGERYARQDARFRYIYQANAGLSAARNTGLAAAQGQYVQLLDADDLLVPTKLATQVAYLEAHAQVDLVYGDVRYFPHGDTTFLSRSMDMQDHQWVARVPETGEALLEVLTKGNIMVVNAPLVRATLMHQVGPFNQALRSMEDWEYWLRCALAGARMHYDDSPLVWAQVRVHPTSMSQNVQRMIAAILQVRHELAGWLRAQGATQAQQINEAGITECYATTGRYQLSEGSIVAGSRDFATAAYRTGQYAYYLKSIPFWLRKRVLASWKKP